ncbi:MAG: hypothetical protein JNM56_40545 [Planctomycetia bacterium]|nr:hypothetical protein [Planctomycetia bacterium]
MTHITLAEEQVRIVEQAKETIQVRDGQGKVLGCIEPSDFTPEEIAEARRSLNSAEPRYTTSQVLEHLRSLGPRC